MKATNSIKIKTQSGLMLQVPLEKFGNRETGTIFIDDVPYHVERMSKKLLCKEYKIDSDTDYVPQTDNDRADLKPGQYLLTEKPPEKSDVKFTRSISAKLRAEVLDRNGFTCVMCGLCPGDIDPSTGRKVRLHIGHVTDKSIGGKDELSNLRALCSTCNQGAKNITSIKPPAIWLLQQIRRAGQEEQKTVYEWLRTKFGEQLKKD